MDQGEIMNEILFEDNHLLIINKRPSQIVQGDKTGDMPLSEILKEFLKTRDQKPGNVFLGVVHRLTDRYPGRSSLPRQAKRSAG